MLVRRLVDRVRKLCGLEVFDTRRRGWVLTRRRVGIKVYYCIGCSVVT